MLESKINQKNINGALDATIDPFESPGHMPEAMEPNTLRESHEDIPFDAEVLYGKKAAENNRHPELSRIETKLGRNVIGYLYTSKRGMHALQCDTDGHKSVLECDVSFEALLTLPNLRKPCKVTPIPDSTLFSVSDPPKNTGYIVTPEKGMCGCQLTFNHEYECRHLKAVYQYQAEHAVAFRKTPHTAADIRSEANDILNDLVAEHHPHSLAAADQLNGMPVYCAICSRELTNPESRRIQIGPVCREKVGMKGEAHLRGNFLSLKLVEASRLYKDAKLQNRILQGCLQLDAPIPVEVIPQKDTEYWSLKRSPILYYLSKDYKAHCLYKVGRKLKYKRLTAQSRETELDCMGWNAAKNLIECLEANGGKKPETSYL